MGHKLHSLSNMPNRSHNNNKKTVMGHRVVVANTAEINTWLH